MNWIKPIKLLELGKFDHSIGCKFAQRTLLPNCPDCLQKNKSIVSMLCHHMKSNRSSSMIMSTKIANKGTSFIWQAEYNIHILRRQKLLEAARPIQVLFVKPGDPLYINFKKINVPYNCTNVVHSLVNC